MNTTTHILFAEALFRRKSIPKSGWAAAAGGLLPDAFLAVFLASALLRQIPETEVWDVEYLREPWATAGAVSNSFFLWGVLLAASLLVSASGPSEKVRSTAKLVAVFAASGCTHLLFDFATHADDAHQHLWPISNWRFHSPLSYWDTDHNARWVRPLEGFLTLGCVIILWRQTRSRVLKTFLALLAIVGLALISSFLLR